MKKHHDINVSEITVFQREGQCTLQMLFMMTELHAELGRGCCQTATADTVGLLRTQQSHTPYRFQQQALKALL